MNTFIAKHFVQNYTFGAMLFWAILAYFLTIFWNKQECSLNRLRSTDWFNEHTVSWRFGLVWLFLAFSSKLISVKWSIINELKNITCILIWNLYRGTLWLDVNWSMLYNVGWQQRVKQLSVAKIVLFRLIKGSIQLNTAFSVQVTWTVNRKEDTGWYWCSKNK